MKLIDREPTQEMRISGQECLPENIPGRSAVATEVFLAMYDAAPEVKQEPVAWEYVEHGRTFLIPHDSPYVHQMQNGEWTPLFSFPPYAQAEITKRGARIAELEERLNEAVGGFKRDLVKQLQDCRKSKEMQAAEITRLREVLAKCQWLLQLAKKWAIPEQAMPHIEETLAAIKEEGL